MRPQSLIAIKSSPANGFDMAACRPWAIRPALPGPRTRGESKSFDPSGRGASQHIVKIRAESSVIQPGGTAPSALLRCRCAATLSEATRTTMQSSAPADLGSKRITRDSDPG
jgi:hypothetical protein